MTRYLAVALTAAVLLLGISTPSRSAMVVPVAPATGIGSTAGWVMGAGFVSALSTIICAHWVGKNQHREMTANEAVLAMLLPLSCMYKKPTN